MAKYKHVQDRADQLIVASSLSILLEYLLSPIAHVLSPSAGE